MNLFDSLSILFDKESTQSDTLLIHTILFDNTFYKLFNNNPFNWMTYISYPTSNPFIWILYIKGIIQLIGDLRYFILYGSHSFE